MNETKKAKDKVKEIMRKNASKGGKTTFELYGSKHFKKIRKMVGKKKVK